MKNNNVNLTFDDVLLLPAYSEILPSKTILATELTKDIKLNIPLVSAARSEEHTSELQSH